MRRDNTKEAIKEALVGLGAEKVEFLYPCNMVFAAVVTYNYMKSSRCFAISNMEFKLSNGPLLEMIKTRFDSAIGSRFNNADVCLQTPTP